MDRSVFINLPTRDLESSRAFYARLGLESDPLFSGENSACVILSEATRLMILPEEQFQRFSSTKPVGDPASGVQAVIAISMESRNEVDRLIDAALEAGATEPREPQDHGFMYGRAFEDPEGRIWEVFHMASPPPQ